MSNFSLDETLSGPGVDVHGERVVDGFGGGGVGSPGGLPWRRWLRALQIYTIGSNASLTSAVWMVYLAGHGYSPWLIGLFEMVFHVAKLLAEVPSGIFADLLGRRKSLILFCLLCALSDVLLLFPTVPLLFLSFICSGCAFAFQGGAFDALIWTISGHRAGKDSQEQSRIYSHIFSRIFALSLLASMVGTALGGYLGNVLTVLPFLAQSVLMLTCIIPLLFVPEQRAGAQGEPRPHPLRHFVQGCRAVWHYPAVLGVLLLSGLATSCWQTIFYYYQLYLNSTGSPLEVIGVVISLSLGTSAFFSWIAPHVMRHIAPRWLIPGLVVMEILSLLLMSSPWPLVSIVSFLLPFQAALAILAPAISTYVNERAPEEQRATILSFDTGLFSLAMIVLFPLFGAGLSHVSYRVAFSALFVILGIGSACIGLLTWWLRRNRTASAR